MTRMTRFPDNLSQEERRSYRRWTRILFLSYAAAIAIAFGTTYFNRPSGDMQATNEVRMARLKPASGPGVSAPAPASARP